MIDRLEYAVTDNTEVSLHITDSPMLFTFLLSKWLFNNKNGYFALFLPFNLKALVAGRQI